MKSKEDYFDLLLSFLQEIEESRASHAELNSQLLDGIVAKGVDATELIEVLKNKSYDNNLDISTRIGVCKLYASFRAKSLLSFVDEIVLDNSDGLEFVEKFPDMLSAFYIMGMWRGFLHCIESCENDHEHCAIDYFHSIKSRDMIEKRWVDDRKKKDNVLEPALDFAEKKWGDENSPIQHNEMADLLLKNFPNLVKGGISKFLITSKLKPIAKKYGRVRGVKKEG